jgi:hypothetical protein
MRRLFLLVAMIGGCHGVEARPEAPSATPQARNAQTADGEIQNSGTGTGTGTGSVVLETVQSSPAFGSNLRYTTFFYTAREAIVHGYFPDTHVRIVSAQTNTPIWEGTVGPGDTELVPTGAGVFSFISDKKATILVGTPSSCTMVGYWARDEEGTHRSDHFYVRVPDSINIGNERVVVWAYEAAHVDVVDHTTGQRLASRDLPAHGRIEWRGQELPALGGHLLDVRSTSQAVAVQVYYDQGFMVPGSDGRGAGRDFLTYVGNIHLGPNDVVLASHHGDARVTIKNIDTGATVFSGTVPRGTLRNVTLDDMYVRIQSDLEITTYVAPVHRDYQEHHFAPGAEGTGIEQDFLLSTPGELWIFSYFDGNEVRVENTVTGAQVWTGTLGAGNVQGLTPGWGMYRVRSTLGSSVMGGAHSCGGEYSPAGRLFAVDDAILQAVIEIRQERVQAAAARGVELSADEAAAPLSSTEIEDASRRVQRRTGTTTVSPAAVQQRVEAMDLQ